MTADRPARLRGTGANQTTDQVGIFGRWCRPSTSPAPATAGRSRLPPSSGGGPTHLNVQLDDPLVPERPRRAGLRRAGRPPRPPPVAEAGAAEPARSSPDRAPSSSPATTPARRRGCWPSRRGWPLLAEPTSGSRTGDHAIRTYRLLLGDGPSGDEVERVVVFGHPTLSRPVTRLLARDDVEVLVDRPAGRLDRAAVPGRRSTSTGPRSRPRRPDVARPVAEADRDDRRALDALLRDEADSDAVRGRGRVSRALPAGGLLFVGASNPIRDLDLMVPPYEVGDRRKVIANRGLSGIDGTVSSAIGAALGRPLSTPQLALMGDVTFLHDANGLVLGPRRARARPDDRGRQRRRRLDLRHARAGRRRARRPLRPALRHPARRRPRQPVRGDPHPALAGRGLPELEQALASPNGGIEVVEVRVPRDNRRELDARIRRLAQR